MHNPNGARYNHGLVVTVYLAEDIDTCLAESSFYFQREYLQLLDNLHINYPGKKWPIFLKPAVLWQVEFQHDVQDVFELTAATAGYFGVFPAMMNNPSQDYLHLKEKRAIIQTNNYNGIWAPSSRSRQGGRILALFHDQSANVAQINPVEVELRLVQPHGGAFNNHASQALDFEACEVRATHPLPQWAQAFGNWKRVDFHH
jgi:RES domain-containing protein